MKIEKLREEALIGGPLRVECHNVPLGDTGEFESVTSIQQGNGGDPIAEVWNAEEHQDKALQYLAHAGNALPEVLKTMRTVADWLGRSSQIEPGQQVSRNKDLEMELRGMVAIAERVPEIIASNKFTAPIA